MRRKRGTPSKWTRGSIIRALALEVGDFLKAGEGVEDADPDSTLERVSPEKERKKNAVEITREERGRNEGGTKEERKRNGTRDDHGTKNEGGKREERETEGHKGRRAT